MATIPTSVLSVIASLGLCMLSWLEHTRSIRPSFIIGIYLFLSVLLDAPRARTLWMLGPYKAIPTAFTCSLILRCAMIVFESIEKRRILLCDVKDVPRDSTSGPFSQSVFYWLSSLFLIGYKNTLTIDDLYPLMWNLESDKLAIDLQAAWDDVPNKERTHALLFTWLSAYRWALLYAAIPRIFMIGFTFAQPFLVSRAIALAASPVDEKHNNFGYGLIGAYVIVYTGIAISTGQYDYIVSRVNVVLRGSVIPSLFRQTLKLDISDTSAEDSLTLINTDLETIGQGVRLLHEIWASPIEVGLSIWLLARQIGLACLVPVGLGLVIMGGGATIALPMGISQAAWIQASQRRVTFTSKALAKIKSLRLSGISGAVFSSIENLRLKELDISRRFRFLLGAAAMFSNCTPVMSPILMFATFVGIATRTGDNFTISKAFTSLSLLSLLNTPLTLILYSFPLLASAVTSFSRIQSYMTRRTRDDTRICGSHNLGELAEGINYMREDRYQGGTRENGIEMQSVPRPDKAGPIVLVRGRASWPGSDEHAIHIPEWSIYRNTFTLILGSVGSGKSTLLRCLLGEHSNFHGEIHLQTESIAFCSEVPWIPARTVQEVIIGQERFDASWYGDILDALALRQDLDTWPLGDRTPVGSRGVALSGGQKHRLALARAVYSRRELLILDNVFSGLDMETKETILHNLFGENGLLRQQKTTTVLASSYVPDSLFADRVAVLNKDGILEEHKSLGFKTERSGIDAVQDRTSSAVVDQRMNASAAEVEDNLTGYTDLAIYKYYFKSAGSILCLIFLSGMAVFAFCQSFPVLWLKWWSEAYEATPNTETGKWLSVYIIVGLTGIVGFLIAIWVLLIMMIAKSGRYFHTLLIETVSRATMGFFSAVNHGSIVNRFSQDMQLVDMELPINATNTSATLFICGAQCIILGISSRYVAVSFPFLVAVFYSIQRFYLRTSRQMRLLEIEHKAPVYSHFVETLSGLSTIRAFGWQSDCTLQMHKVLDNSQRPYYLLYCLQAWLLVVLNLITAVLAMIIISITTTLRANIGPGYVGVSLTNILTFSSTVKSLISAWVGLEISIGAVARIRNFTSETNREQPIHTALQPGLGWPNQGCIEYRNVSATYGSSEMAINNVSFSIEGGQKIAICGRTGRYVDMALLSPLFIQISFDNSSDSGPHGLSKIKDLTLVGKHSGKSSLALCLFRMLDILDGQVLVDDVDILSLEPEYVRNRLVAVPQDIVIFEGTVRLNLDPTNSVTESEIIQTLKRVQMWAIVEGKGGLDSDVNESSFSQGEQQLLGFARAMLRKSHVLVLDEATSSVDNETKKVIDQLLDVHFKNWTVISILHQLDTVLSFDKVAVMDNSRLIEFDKPDFLLASNSTFQKLFQIHSRQN